MRHVAPDGGPFGYASFFAPVFLFYELTEQRTLTEAVQRLQDHDRELRMWRLAGARDRAGLKHATCHQLRHTCLTQLRAAGMPLEAVQARAGHACIESTRIYLHRGGDWLAAQYRKASEVIDAQIFAIGPPLARPAPPHVPVFTGTTD